MTSLRIFKKLKKSDTFVSQNSDDVSSSENRASMITAKFLRFSLSFDSSACNNCIL